MRKFSYCAFSQSTPLNFTLTSSSIVHTRKDSGRFNLSSHFILSDVSLPFLEEDSEMLGLLKSP